jgi:hypothetical protein
MSDQSNRQATADELQRDAVGIADQVFQSWDSEVDCVVILIPRKQPRAGKLDIYVGSTATSVELIKTVAEGIRQKAPHLVNLRGRG